MSSIVTKKLVIKMKYPIFLILLITAITTAKRIDPEPPDIMPEKNSTDSNATSKSTNHTRAKINLP